VARLRPFASLRARLALLTAAALLPALLLALVGYFKEQSHLIELAVAELEQERELLASAHHNTLNATRQLLAALARLPQVRQRAAGTTSELLTALKAEHPIYLNLFANAPDGTAFASAEPLPERVNSADTAWFQRAAAGTGFVVGDFIRGRITGEQVLTLSYPVREADGTLLAVVGASLPLSWFGELVAQQHLPAGTTVTLVDERGEVIGHYGPSSAPLPALVAASFRLLHTPTGSLSLDHGGERWEFAHSQLLTTAAGRQVLLAVGRPIRLITPPANQLLVTTLTLMAVMTLLGVGGALLGSRLFIEPPLQRLLATTRRLANGDLAARSGIHNGPAELLELGQHFDRMASVLEQRKAELRALVEENRRGREQAEARHEMTQRDLEAVLRRVQDVIFRLDIDGRPLWSTQSVKELSGVPAKEGHYLDLCRCLADPADLARLLARLAESGGELRGFEVKLPRDDGGPLYAAINAYYVWDEEGQPVAVEGVARDITEQVLAREQLVGFNRRLEARVRERTAALEQTNAELEAFTYSVSHDLRAPLRSIEGFSRLVVVRYADQLPAEGQDYLQRVQRAANRMAELIDDLLGLSRINRYELRVREIDLSRIAHEIIDTLRAQAPQRQVTVRIQPQLRGHCDPRLCRLALENLLENAWKYTSTRAQAEIELTAQPDANGRTVFQLRDNGVGFDMRYAGKLFSPFQRLHGEEEFAGTGIGLATVQRVIARHGGEIWAEAVPDQGATFYFRLCGDAQAERAA